MNARQVRVTNPSIEEVVVKIAQPAKVVGAFAAGVGLGNVVTAPLTDRIDQRWESGVTRGIVKLSTATACLAAIAYVTEQGKKKPSTDTKAMLAAASMGSVSRMVITGIDDLMGRGEDAAPIIEAEIIEESGDDDEEAAAMNGSLLEGNFFNDQNMSGGSQLFASRPFGAYLES